MKKLFLITILISAAWGQVQGKEECTEYGCFKIFTEMDNWIDGTIQKGLGLRPSGYTGYESMPMVNDDIPFAILNAIEKSSRSAAASVVNVIGDRCLYKRDDPSWDWPPKVLMVTHPYTGFFIDKNHIVTTSKISENFEFQENNNWTFFGDAMYSVPCKEIPEMIYPNRTDFKTSIQGEGVFIQLFNGDWGLGTIVHTSGYLSIVKVEKYTDNFESVAYLWDEWSNYNKTINPLAVANSTVIKNLDAVIVHNTRKGSFGGGWKTTLSNLSNCPENDTRNNSFYLDVYSDDGSLGSPVVDDFGYVIGVTIGFEDATKSTCSTVESSSNRNSLGSLSSFLADDLTVTNVLNSRELTNIIDEYSTMSENFSPIESPKIIDIAWPKNALTISEMRVERIDWGDDFTDSGFPKSELESSAIDIAKQGTLIFVRKVGCIQCEEKEKDLDFAGDCACTGFAVTNDLIVTNDHCVSKVSIGGRAMSIGDRATFKTYFGQIVDAKLIGKSSIDGDGSYNDFYREIFGFDGSYDFHKGDVALLRSSQILELEPLVLGNSSNLKQYDPLISVGHPGIMVRTGPYVVSVGSFIGKNTWANSEIYYNLPVEGGNSGSGVFNLKGEVIGQISNSQEFGRAEEASIVYSKYGLLATELRHNQPRGASRPQPWSLTSKIDVTKGSASSGAPSNYIKELIELWAPGELGY